MTAHSLCRKMLTERSGGLHTEISSFRTAACPPIKKAGFERLLDGVSWRGTRRGQTGCPLRVKNGPDAPEMRCLYHPRKQTSVSYAADSGVIACYGGAKPTDKHLASTIHCIDDEIIDWLQRR